MQMTERYVLSSKAEGESAYTEIDTYATEEEAAQDMESDAHSSDAGSWKIDRVMTVTVQTISKARLY